MDKEIRLGRFDKWGYKNRFSKGELARELTYMNRDYDKLEQQVKKQKEVIDKAREYVNKNLIVSSILDGKKTYCLNDYKFNYEKLLDILKEK